MKLNRILKGSRTAEIDSKAISGGIDSKSLMKNAGSGISKGITGDFENKKLNRAARGLVVCGRGNNGGDGFVAAKDLMNYGMRVIVFHISPVEEFSHDSLFYFKELKEAENSDVYYLNLEDKKISSSFKEELELSLIHI